MRAGALKWVRHHLLNARAKTSAAYRAHARRPGLEELEQRLVLSTWYIAPAGSDGNAGTINQPFASLAQASSVARPGDTVYARGGLYAPTSMQYLGSSGTAAAPITYAAYPGESPVIDGSHTPNQAYTHLITITGQYIVFEGFTLQNAHGAGLQSWGGSHLQILNNTIHDNQDNAITLGTNDSLTRTTDILVQGNIAYRNALNNNGQSWGGGIGTSGASYVRFINNTIYDNMGEGLALLLCDHCVAQGNVVHDNFSVNIYLDNATNTLVEQNFVYSTFDPTYYRDSLPAAGIQVANESYGLVNPAHDDTIVNNIVKDGNPNFMYGNYGRGGGMPNFLVANNVFYQASNFAGFYIDSGDNPTHNSAVFANNIFYQSNGLPLTYFRSALSGVTFEHNNWFSGDPGVAAGPGDVAADPQFVNGGSNDPNGYRLQATSPDIGQGVNFPAVNSDFFGTPRSQTDIGAVSATANTATGLAEQQFVAQLYQDMLQRAAGASEVASWTSVLDRGTSRTQVAAAIAGSAEYRGDEVQNLYSKLLGRSADTGGLNGWVAFLGQAHTITQVETAIVGSDEYFARHGASNAGFLQGVYQDVLGRTVDAGGAVAWGQALAHGLSHGSLAAAILGSQEACNDMVEALYLSLLRRNADAGGLQGFTSAMQAGATVEGIIAGLAGSQEYFQRASP